MTEVDTPPQPNTFRRFLWETVTGIVWARAFWGRRLLGGAIGLVADSVAEASSQAFYARLPGHPQQAPDSLIQNAKDRDLFRFRGETDANWKARVREAWDDYEQAGTKIQLLHVINQWGVAGWPVTWNPAGVHLVETSGEGLFHFTLTIDFGLIDPPWVPELYGSGSTYGEFGLFYGIGLSTDIPILLYLVRKWKRQSSLGFVKVYWSATDFVTFTVG